MTGNKETGGPEQGTSPLEEAEAAAAKAEGEALAGLTEHMSRALAFREEGKDDKAKAVFVEMLKAEPRLAEPRLELAHIAATGGDWEEAEAQARLAVEILRSGGQWNLDLEPPVLLAFALNLLGEILVRPVEEGDLFLKDKEAFATIWNEAAGLFEEGSALDPDNEEIRRNQTRYRRLPT